MKNGSRGRVPAVEQIVGCDLAGNVDLRHADSRTGSNGDYLVRPASVTDVPALVEIHIHALPDDLLSRLGRGFLARCYFPGVIGHPDFATMVLVSGDRVLGFAVAANHGSALIKLVFRNIFSGLSPVVAQVLRHPSTIHQVLCYFGRKTELTPEGVSILRQPHVELAAFSMSEDARGKGAGGLLLTEVLKRLEKETSAVILCSDAPNAVRFFTKHGFGQIGSQCRCSRALQVLACALRKC